MSHSLLSDATSEPLIATPEVTNGISLDNSCSFLILMSYGTYKAVRDATGTKHVNAEIAAMVAAEFAVQSTLNGVAQAVVDKIVRRHHDTFMTTMDVEQKQLCQERKDITLLVRNFNYQLPNATRSPIANQSTNPFAVAMQQAATKNNNMETPLSIAIPDGKQPENSFRPFFPHSNNRTVTSSTMTTRTNATSNSYSSTTDSTNSNEDSQSISRSQKLSSGLPLDSDGRIESYVDFSEYYAAIDALSVEDKASYDAEVELKPAYETIHEEKEACGETTEAA